MYTFLYIFNSIDDTMTAFRLFIFLYVSIYGLILVPSYLYFYGYVYSGVIIHGLLFFLYAPLKNKKHVIFNIIYNETYDFSLGKKIFNSYIFFFVSLLVPFY